MNDRGEKTIENKQTLIERLAHQLGVSANAEYIYAEPIKSGGITIVPVAKAIYGFGGGSGKKVDEEGSGGGGGIVLKPVGYIEIKNGESCFRPTRDWLTVIPVLAAASTVILMNAWGFSKLFRRKRAKRKYKKNHSRLRVNKN